MTLDEKPDPISKRSTRFRFNSRQLFSLTLMVAILFAWWLDRRQMQGELRLLRMRLGEGRMGVDSVASARPLKKALSPDAFVSMVAYEDDWYALQDALVPFRNSDARGEAVKGLVELLDDPKEEVRTRALTSLSQINVSPEIIVPAVTALLDDPETNVQWHAANVLSGFPEESADAAGRLKDLMMDDECGIATYSAVVLKKVDPSVNIGPRLIELAKSPIRENRWRALRHLPDHVDSETAVAFLEKRFAVETDEEIRQIIADAINRVPE